MSYEKYHDPWAATDLLSAAALNWIESQWDEILADADTHDHDTRYYTKTLSDTTFFSLTYHTGFDADKLDGQHLSDLVANVLPAGSIMIWSGTDEDIPDGWAVCNGQASGGCTTPDLRDRFVVGSGTTYAPGVTGGAGAYDAECTPTGTITIAAHTLTTAELPAHTHSYQEFRRVGAYQYYQREYATYNALSSTIYNRSISIEQQATGGGSHGHSGSTISFSALDTRPEYYALFYIMKVG